MTSGPLPGRAAPGGPAPFRILCFSAHAPSAGEIALAVGAVAPSAEVEPGDLAVTLDAPEADLFVVDATADAMQAMELVRVIRARGAAAPVLVVAGDASQAGEDDAHRMGAALVPIAGLAEMLPREIERAASRAALAAASPSFAALAAAAGDARRLIAAGLIARRVKHDINNSLAALQAEAQLLELEPLPAEAMEAIQRMVELCRRATNVARQLEGPSPRGADAAQPGDDA